MEGRLRSKASWARARPSRSGFLDGRPARIAGVPQLGPAAVSARAAAITDVQTRLGAIDASDWSVAGKVDYLLVWAKANGMEFEHRVTRPWQKDPIHYLDQIRRVPYVDLPLSGQAAARWRGSVAAVPEILRQAEDALVAAREWRQDRIEVATAS